MFNQTFNHNSLVFNSNQLKTSLYRSTSKKRKKNNNFILDPNEYLLQNIVKISLKIAEYRVTKAIKYKLIII